MQQSSSRDENNFSGSQEIFCISSSSSSSPSLSSMALQPASGLGLFSVSPPNIPIPYSIFRPLVFSSNKESLLIFSSPMSRVSPTGSPPRNFQSSILFDIVQLSFRNDITGPLQPFECNIFQYNRSIRQFIDLLCFILHPKSFS